MLLDRGADIHHQDIFSETPLLLACKKGHVKIVDLLLERGADIEQQNKFGWTPFFYAVKWHQLDVVQFLVDQRGANIDRKDKFGRTPLEIALNGYVLWQSWSSAVDVDMVHWLVHAAARRSSVSLLKETIHKVTETC